MTSTVVIGEGITGTLYTIELLKTSDGNVYIKNKVTTAKQDNEDVKKYVNDSAAVAVAVYENGKNNDTNMGKFLEDNPLDDKADSKALLTRQNGESKLNTEGDETSKESNILQSEIVGNVGKNTNKDGLEDDSKDDSKDDIKDDSKYGLKALVADTKAHKPGGSNYVYLNPGAMKKYPKNVTFSKRNPAKTGKSKTVRKS